MSTSLFPSPYLLALDLLLSSSSNSLNFRLLKLLDFFKNIYFKCQFSLILGCQLFKSLHYGALLFAMFVTSEFCSTEQKVLRTLLLPPFEEKLEVRERMKIPTELPELEYKKS